MKAATLLPATLLVLALAACDDNSNDGTGEETADAGHGAAIPAMQADPPAAPRQG